jgi:ATP-dependent exoDNAse (exonuclease V) alpha subunit
VLVGQAGTGKGVVLRAACGAWRREGYAVIGTAVAGATAERLGADAKLERSLTTDALLSRVENGNTTLDEKTVVMMDEAGMADTRRLAKLVELTGEHRSKLVLAGDSAQLSPIGAGGLFKEIEQRTPTAELKEVHRAHHDWERRAWSDVREGSAARALAAYQAHERLHLTDTRQQAAERMLADWDRQRLGTAEGRTVMLTDASNHELDQINRRAQQYRDQAGELGARRAKLPDRPYDLAAGDHVIFTKPLYRPGQQRIENGTLATIQDVHDKQNVTIKTHGPKQRELPLDTSQFADLRLAYAQHVYKAQGLTTDRALTMLGGWQTDRERAYVALTRAREQTHIYAAREDLGHQGLDTEHIQRLAQNMSESHAQEASIARQAASVECDRAAGREQISEPERDLGLSLA